MALILGSKLGSYEILSLLGVGGMGEVYRARDPRLNREVAIKVLPPERMADEELRRRFIQEARAASHLNHPNIVTVHEVDSVDGVDFIVMEYVVGKTLSDSIPRRGMSLDRVLKVAIPIADALAHAHGAGIVHRDLKPANVMVGALGAVKVLDFGLAKLLTSRDAALNSETATADGVRGPRSRTGTVVGTIGYMSPEQAVGGNVDTRSDVFSFGALLYEMATGRRAFAGGSMAEVLAALMKEQPKAPSEVVPDLPKELDRLIQRCLRKEPERRFQHMLDAKLELEQIKEESETGRTAAPVPARSTRAPWLVAGVVGLVLAAAGAWLRTRPAPLPMRVVSITNMAGAEGYPSLSPDGEQVAFVWNGEKNDGLDLYIKIIGFPDVRRLTTRSPTDINGTPSWSPDGRQIAFVRYRLPDLTGTIRLVSRLGGSDRKLGDFVTSGRPSWSPDGRWLVAARVSQGAGAGPSGFPRQEGLYLLPVEGGEPRLIPLPRGAGNASCPHLSPDGRHLAYMSCGSLSCYLEVVELGADFVPRSPPRRLTPRPVFAFGDLAWTRDGKSLLFVDDGMTQKLWRVAIDGREAPMPVELAGQRVRHPVAAVSRDRLVFSREKRDLDIYRFDAGRPATPVVASSGLMDYDPDFSPDGRRIVFASQRSGEDQEIWLAEADGSGSSPLTRGTGLVQGSPRWSPDGRRIAYDAQGEDGHFDIWTIEVDGGPPRRLTQGPGNENVPSWSRDGRFVYFASDRQGLPPEVWRIPASGGTEERVTHGGGFCSHESVDGKTLYFQRSRFASPLLAQPLAGGTEKEVVKCVSIFTVGPAGLYSLECSDHESPPLFLRDPVTSRGRPLGKLDAIEPDGLTVSPDGKTILFTKVVGEGADLMMIENFR